MAQPQEASAWQKEWASWKSPKPVETAQPPAVGAMGPSLPKLRIPNKDGKPTIITFLRHCGCPCRSIRLQNSQPLLITLALVAEKTFIHFRALANKHPEALFIAVSHSDQAATDKWVISVGGEWDTHIIVDTERELYAAWGLGVSTAWHVLNPFSMYSVFSLGKQENIWNRPTESGSRWQTSGSFAVDAKGVVRWAKVAATAADLPDFTEAMKAVQLKP